jgi:CPA2 family monovalent cation:H+ antiporter-2
LAQAGSLAPLLQPFAALYVLLLATLAPLLAKESERIYALLVRLNSRGRLRRVETTSDITAN